MIKIILAYNQKIVREGLRRILNLEKEIQIIAEVDNGGKLLQVLQKNTADVILMDIRMPVIDGVKATKLIKRLHPDTKIIILTSLNEEEYIFKAISSGADGYLLKNADPEYLLNAIKSVYNGAISLDPKVTTKVVNAFSTLANEAPADSANPKLAVLTQREIDVVSLVAQGKNNKDIAKILFLTEGTVKNYVTRILSKLELHSRTELAIYMTQINDDSLTTANNLYDKPLHHSRHFYHEILSSTTSEATNSSLA